MRFLAAAAATASPARTEPVMETRPAAGLDTTISPVFALPSTTLKVPSGRNSEAISANSRVDSGVVSEGLSTMVLPAARAGPTFQMAIISG